MPEENESNVVSVFGGNVPMHSSADLLAAMEEQQQQNSDPGGEDNYISFSGKTGRYAIGSEKRDTDPNELFLVNISSFLTGWMCWKGGRPETKRFAGLGEPAIPTPDMEENGPFKDGEGWSPAMAFTLKSLESEEQYFFSTSSGSGVRHFREFQKEIVQRARAGEAAWPVISLSSDKFTGNGMAIPKPNFIREHWLDDAQLAEVGKVPLEDLLDASPAEGKTEVKTRSRRNL